MATSTLAMALLFGTAAAIRFGVKIAGRSATGGTPVDFGFNAGQKFAPALECTWNHVLLLCKECSMLGLLLAYAYVCEHFPPFEHSKKHYSRDMFLFLTVLLFLASLGTVKTSKTDDLLNREQTEEWKGWMQFLFLLYHYLAAKEAYNLIRILITAYVWMTGFGNFSFFYIKGGKGGFGFTRWIQMIWRLNFLAIFLCLTMNNSYSLYYICPLHTLFFVVTYAACRVGVAVNHDKWGVRVKLLAVGAAVLTLWDLPFGLFRGIFAWIPEAAAMCSTIDGLTPCPVGGHGALWEFYFRTSLDHWSTFLGMVFALNYPISASWLTETEKLPPHRQWLVKGIVAVPWVLAFGWWLSNIYVKTKAEFNQVTAYFGFIPVYTYIYLRNMHKPFRGRYLGLLAKIGKITLETYLLQHHIWLTSNAKTLLTFVPGYPLINMAVVTVLYVMVSNELYRLTMTLRGMLLPNNATACQWNLAGISAAIAVAMVLAELLQVAHAVNLVSVLAVVATLAGAVCALVNSLTKLRSEQRQAALKRLVCVALAFAVLGNVMIHTAGSQGTSASLTSSDFVAVDATQSAAAVGSRNAAGVDLSAPSHPAYGSMGHPLEGLMALCIAAAMLLFMDNFAGASLVAALVIGRRDLLDWSKAFDPLHAKHGLGPSSTPLPSSVVPSEESPTASPSRG